MTCSHCRENKSLPSHGWCRFCLQKDQRKRQKARRAYIDALKDAPCLDCGKRFPLVCMDFDHVRGKKKFNISRVGNKSMKSLIDELEKCELICANCHRIRSQYQNWNKGVT